MTSTNNNHTSLCKHTIKMTKESFCPIQKTLKLIGGKWKLVILFNLQAEPKRFGELKRSLSPITQQMLTKELRDLEKNNFIIRKVYEVIPPKVEYSLSQHGKTLKPIFDSIQNFSNKNIKILAHVE